MAPIIGNNSRHMDGRVMFHGNIDIAHPTQSYKICNFHILRTKDACMYLCSYCSLHVLIREKLINDCTYKLYTHQARIVFTCILPRMEGVDLT